MTKTKIILIVTSVLSIFLGLIAAYTVYNNNKTDGLNNGQITVSSCREIDWSWRIYSCTGDYFSTGGGMVERSNVSVTTFTREYQKGDIIPDVYPPAFSSSQTTDYFVTGRERASVGYNLPWLFAIFLATILPITSLILYVSTRNKGTIDT